MMEPDGYCLVIAAAELLVLGIHMITVSSPDLYDTLRVYRSFSNKFSARKINDDELIIREHQVGVQGSDKKTSERCSYRRRKSVLSGLSM